MKDEEDINPRIKVRYIISINRMSTADVAKEIVDLALEYKLAEPNYFMGLELSGDPR